MLRVLACRCGDAVGKDALFDQVWGGIAVTGDSLVQCIGEIRQALGAAREVVRTLPGFGYMLAEPPAPQITDAEPIRFVTAPDRVHIAWTASGRGVPPLKVLGWSNSKGDNHLVIPGTPAFDQALTAMEAFIAELRAAT